MEEENTAHIWNLIARKVSGEAGQEDLDELEQLLRQYPEGHYAMEILHDLWKNETDPNRQYAEHSFKELVQKMKNMGIDEGRFSSEDHIITQNSPGSAVRSNKRLLALVSVTVIAATIAVLFFLRPKNEIKATGSELVKNEISTKNGSKSNLVLPDGTKVYLNAGSKLTYDKNFDKSNRTVNLSGEAFFDVVKNPEHPFIIHTHHMDIKVIGTAFNVKCYPEEKESETSLVRGNIEITLKDRKEKIMLKPNEKLIIHDEIKLAGEMPGKMIRPSLNEVPMLTLSHLTLLPEDNSIMETSWLQNKLVFRSETFEDVAVKMERWFGVTIRFKEELLKSQRLTGIFKNETLSQALIALQLTTRFNYRISKDSVLLSIK